MSESLGLREMAGEKIYLTPAIDQVLSNSSLRDFVDIPGSGWVINTVATSLWPSNTAAEPPNAE